MGQINRDSDALLVQYDNGIVEPERIIDTRYISKKYLRELMLPAVRFVSLLKTPGRSVHRGHLNARFCFPVAGNRGIFQKCHVSNALPSRTSGTMLP